MTEANSATADLAPKNPDAYSQEIDPVKPRIDAYAKESRTNTNPQWHCTQIQTFLPIYPFQDILTSFVEQQSLQTTTEVLKSFVESNIQTYLTQVLRLDREISFEGMDDIAIFALCMTWIGDRSTGEHCVQTWIMINPVIILAQETNTLWTPGKKELENLRAAALLHDNGKADLPRMLLELPFPWKWLRAAYFGNLADPKRHGHPAFTSLTITEDDRIRFHDLLSGDWDEEAGPPEDQIRAFIELCDAQRADFRQTPVRYLIRIAEHMLANNGEIPEEVLRYLEAVNPAEHAFIMQRLRAQAAGYKYKDWTLSRHGLDGYGHTLITALQRHESASFYSTGSGVRCYAANHHGYSSTTQTLATEPAFTGFTPHKTALHALTLTDILTALSQNRAYCRNGQARPPEKIAKVLLSEADKRHIPTAFVQTIIKRLLSPQSTIESPMMHIIKAGSQITA